MAARVETRLRSSLRLRLRMRVKTTESDVYVTVPTREAKGSAVGDPCASPVQSCYSRDRQKKMCSSNVE